MNNAFEKEVEKFALIIQESIENFLRANYDFDDQTVIGLDPLNNEAGVNIGGVPECIRMISDYIKRNDDGSIEVDTDFCREMARLSFK